VAEKRWVWWAVLCLVVVQIAQTVYVVHRESLTFDEGNHMFAGYIMWHTGDYGLNPEHPPLVKLLATLPQTRRDLWVPKLQDRNFKTEAYLEGRDWLARNDGATQHMVFEMRLMAGLLAVGLSLMVFFAARAWFGTATGLIALVLVTFDPTVVGNSALVTTDVGVSLFFLASIFTFYRYVKQPSVARLLVAGLTAGLLLVSAIAVAVVVVDDPPQSLVVGVVGLDDSGDRRVAVFGNLDLDVRLGVAASTYQKANSSAPQSGVSAMTSNCRPRSRCRASLDLTAPREAQRVGSKRPAHRVRSYRRPLPAGPCRGEIVKLVKIRVGARIPVLCIRATSRSLVPSKHRRN